MAKLKSKKYEKVEDTPLKGAGAYYGPTVFPPPFKVTVPAEYFSDTAYVTFKTIAAARFCQNQALGDCSHFYLS